MPDRETRHAELAERYLPDEILDEFRVRAAEDDQENRFFEEDLVELRRRGYLTLFVPARFGGPGLTLNEVSRLQQRLAGAAPATALAVNMHLMCTGVARALSARGDDSMASIFDEALAGEVFAFGISESSNDWVLQDSRTVATPQDDGGYLLAGVKIFTSLSPAWTRLLVHGRDDSGGAPELVYGLLERADGGTASSDRWDVLGMRASQSRATVLEGARLRPERVLRRVPVGPSPDLLTFAIAANFQLLIGSVYAGIARRAIDVGAAGLRARRSAKAAGSFAEVPEFRARIARELLDYQSVPAQLDATTRDFDDLVDHGADWSLRLVSARISAGDAARRAAETALACVGGSGFDNEHEASRLLRDATASLFHPPGTEAALPMFAAALLDD